MGVDSRSLANTLVQLIGRPGYLVRDYISGHRQVSFPPVNMLVIVCLLVVIFETVFHLHKDLLPFQFHHETIDNAIAWINSQKSWAMLLVQSPLILPTWVVFLFAPAYPRHSLPEGFFLQVFLSVQGLLFSFFGYWSTSVENLLCLIYMCLTYRQLFGYSWWGTLWQLVVTYVSCLIIALPVLLALMLPGYDEHDYVGGHVNNDNAVIRILIVTAALILLAAGILFVTHLINRRTDRKLFDLYG